MKEGKESAVEAMKRRIDEMSGPIPNVGRERTSALQALVEVKRISIN
jgi:hypothetical protein